MQLCPGSVTHATSSRPYRSFSAFAVVRETDAVATVPARMPTGIATTLALSAPANHRNRTFAVHALWHRRNGGDPA